MVDGEMDSPDEVLARLVTACRVPSAAQVAEWQARWPDATAEILEGIERLRLRAALPTYDEVVEATDMTDDAKSYWLRDL